MDAQILRDVVSIIRAEEARRANLRQQEEGALPADAAATYIYDRWLFTDAPFISELCFMLFVTLRHQVGRQLVDLAVRKTDDGKEIAIQKYKERKTELKKGNNWNWTEINSRLALDACTGYEHTEVLRHLANSYKHNPLLEPSEELLNKLGLDIGKSYLPLPESQGVQSALATSVGLMESANYCDIAEKFLDVAHDFLADVECKAGPLSQIKQWDATPFDPEEATL